MSSASDSESSCTSPTPSSASGKLTSSTKRCNKPQMERKRRERINCSLNVLKQLVLDALKKDTSQYSKLEKADILEMTVKHLRELQRVQLVKAASSDVTVVGKYRAGYTECASEVTRYLGSVDGVKPEVRDRLVNHLNGCVQRVHTTPAHVERQQQHLHPAQAHYTATSGVPVYQYQQQQQSSPLPVSATRPIQIQIPVATSPASLPGAGVQALQMAVPAATISGSSVAASAASSGIHFPRTAQAAAMVAPSSCSAAGSDSPEQAGSPPHTTATYSPVSTPPAAYMAAFQVIPNAQSAFMLPQGQLATPIYAVNATPVQQAQIQQLILSQMAAAGTTTNGTTSSTVRPATTATVASAPAPVAPSGVNQKRRADQYSQHHHSDSSHAIKKIMTSYNPKVVTSYSAKVAINDTLRDEKVWRPW